MQAQHHRFTYNEGVRREWQDPEQILTSLGLAGGQTFVDIGANDGFFAVPAARMVGPGGKVYAVDIDRAAIARLREKAEAEQLPIETRVGDAADTVFCRGCADIVFLGMVLHHFDDKVTVLTNARRMVKPRGMLVNIDWKKEHTVLGPPLGVRLTENEVAGLMAEAGLAVYEVTSSGKELYMVTAVVSPER